MGWTLNFIELLAKVRKVMMFVEFSFEDGSSSTAFPVPRNTETPKVSVWVPITVILLLAIFSAIMVLCSHKFRRICQKNVRNDRASTGGSNAVQMTLSVTNDRPAMPETPPPAYASLERQFSYVSHISQNSSQIEIPPEYDQMSQIVTTSSLERGLKSTNISSSARERLFLRSISALEKGTPPKTPSQGMPASSSMILSNVLIFERNEEYLGSEEETNGSMPPGSSQVPDVVRETSPRGTECLHRQLATSPGGPDNSLSESGRVVFTMSEDSQSIDLEELASSERTVDANPETTASAFVQESSEQ